jgi:hypothetical protein
MKIVFCTSGFDPFAESCNIVEIQYGMRCDEDDIERR